MKTLLTALLFAATLTGVWAQSIGLVTDTNGNIVTRRTNTLTFTNPVAWTTNVVAQTRTNLFTGGLVPSGAAATNAVLTADGTGGSTFVQPLPVYFAKQAADTAVVTNPTTFFGDLTISNIPAGTYILSGYLARTNVGGGVQYRLLSTNQIVSSRGVFISHGAGSIAPFYNTTTEMLNDGDQVQGNRVAALFGYLIFTNDGWVQFFPRNVGGSTNTFQILSGSFIRLQKID